jgi:phosphatidylethanolamine/phosphatidyl-N-methylethanolamine N-methyltransferase
MPDLSATDVVQSYRLYAPMYNLLFGAVLEPGRKALARSLTAFQPRRILELGVGTGLMLPLYPQDAAVVGVDLSPEMLALASERAAALPGRRIELMCADVEQLAPWGEPFDCVTLPYVLSVTPHPDRLLQAAMRLCKPGGRILVLNHFSGGRFWSGLERLASPLAKRIGFRSDFRFEDHLGPYQDRIESLHSVNLLGLSKLVVLKNDAV